MVFLNVLPGPVQAGSAVVSPDGITTGIPVSGSPPVSLTSRQIGQQGSASSTAEGLPMAGQLNKQPLANGMLGPRSFSGFPSLAYSFPGNTVYPGDIDNLSGQRVPPDTMGTAGPSQFVMAINGRLRVFTKATGVPETPFGSTDPDLETFFAPVMTPAGGNVTNSANWPRVRYDRFSGRWFILAADAPVNAGSYQPNRIMLVVSDGPVITAGTTWKFFYFQPNLVLAGFSNAYAGSPSLGIDVNALYIGVNLLTTAGQAFNNSAAFVVRKSSLLNPGQPVVTGFAPLIGTDGPMTPQGVDNLDSSVGEGYFIGVNASGGSSLTQLQLRKVLNPGGTPSISANIPVTIPAVQQPLPVPHKGGGNTSASLLNPQDFNLSNAVIQKGSLWTAHSIGVNNSGVSNNLKDRDGVRWYEIALPASQGSSPVLRQSGTVYDNSGSQRYYWLPSLTVSGQGHTAIGFNVAGANDYISAAFTGRTASDNLGTTRSPVFYKTSTGPYTPLNNPASQLTGRSWGRYSFTSLDPEDNMTFWTIQEYAYNYDADHDGIMDGYGIEIARINAPLPASIVSLNPSFIIAGQSNVDITISGSAVDASGFYDPGPAFSKHLTASAGGGVTVNSVTYLDPTTVKINISAVGVPPGQYDVSITNPDGQTVTASNLLKVNCYQAVSDNVADGAPGSLREAVNNINSGGCPTINLKDVTHPITLTGPLNLPPGIVLSTAKDCSAGQVEIRSDGSDNTSLTLNGGDFFGIYIHGFKVQPFAINAGTGPNRLGCVKVGTT